MANFATRHNRGSLFNIDTTDYEYISPKDLFADNPGTIFVVGGLYLNNRSKFGPSAVAILPEIHKMLNLPQHMTEEVVEILGNAEDVDDIRNGRVGITLEAYTSRKYNRDCIGVNWVDL
jgi:hypothetical protein